MFEEVTVSGENSSKKEIKNIDEPCSKELLYNKFPLKILVVEDNAINQKIVISLLSSMGYKVQTVINGQEAVDKIKIMDFDIVFMDIQMPVMNGLEATHKIKSEVPAEKQPLIIALTANSGINDKEGCYNAGMVDHISKPINIDILQNALMKWGNYINMNKMQ